MAVVAGLFGSMLGVGGGIIMVPVLSLAFGAPIKVAIATSIVCVIATSTMAQTSFVSRGMTNVRLGMLLEVATTVGAVAGGITAVLIDGHVLQASFAVVLVYVAWTMNRRGADAVPERTGVLEAHYYDPVAGDVVYGVKRLQLGFFLSLAAGLIAGGPWLLKWFGSGKQMLPPGWLCLMSLDSFLLLQFTFWGTLIFTQNRLPYLWPTVATNVLSLLLSLTLIHFTSLGLGALVLGPLLAGSLFNYWYWPPYAARCVGTTLFRFLFRGSARQNLQTTVPG